MARLLRKCALSVFVLLGVVYGYQDLTDKSIATLPGDLVSKLNQKGPAVSTNPTYYQDPAKRYNETTP